MQKILLLEDDATLGNGIVLALNSESSEIILCVTPTEARKAYRDGAFQLLIIDINLPDGNGLDFLREVRRQDSVPIILLTANDMEIDIVSGLESGAPNPFPWRFCGRESRPIKTDGISSLRLF